VKTEVSEGCHCPSGGRGCGSPLGGCGMIRLQRYNVVRPVSGEDGDPVGARALCAAGRPATAVNSESQPRMVKWAVDEDASGAMQGEEMGTGPNVRMSVDQVPFRSGRGGMRSVEGEGRGGLCGDGYGVAGRGRRQVAWAGIREPLKRLGVGFLGWGVTHSECDADL
jgi:hypothetical protein